MPLIYALTFSKYWMLDFIFIRFITCTLYFYIGIKEACNEGYHDWSNVM